MVDVVIQPTRAEPFFEHLPEFDVTRLRITVRWADYLDNLGGGVNDLPIEISDELAGLETEIRQIASIQNELVKSIEDALSLLTNINNFNARLAEMTKRINDLEALI